MQMMTIRLVTIIAEGVLESRLLDEIKGLGARGHTISQVHGRGTRGISASFWEGQQVKIEVLVSAEVAERIMQLLADSYFADYSVVGYVHPVDVIRGEKYL